jgi:hypothetical protein
MPTRSIAACTLVLLAGCATGAGTARSAPVASAQQALTASAGAPAKVAAKEPVCDYEAITGTRIKTKACRPADDAAGRAAAQKAMNEMLMRGAQQNVLHPGG